MLFIFFGIEFVISREYNFVIKMRYRLSCCIERGMGDVVVPMLITVVGVCVLRVSWILITSKICPIMEVIIFNYPVTWIASGLLFIFYYKYRIKKIEAIFEKR